jgi:hypothetical protein
VLTVSLRRVWFSILCALGLWASIINAQQTMDYLNLSAADAARLIREGTISSVDLVSALLNQIDAGSHLHAFILIERDGALRAAEDADRKRRQGILIEPLHGAPIVIKDNIHLAGLPNTAGTPRCAASCRRTLCQSPKHSSTLSLSCWARQTCMSWR